MAIIVGCQCITMEKKLILILRKVNKLILYHIMKYGLFVLKLYTVKIL